MRFIYKIMIGLIIFNSLLVLFSAINIGGRPLFPLSTLGEDAINITGNETYTGYKVTGGIFSWDTLTITVMGISVALGLFTGWILKSPVPVGAALFSGFIVALFIAPASMIYNLDPTHNWVVSSIISLIAIIIGILASLTIVETFMQQRGAD